MKAFQARAKPEPASTRVGGGVGGGAVALLAERVDVGDPVHWRYPLPSRARSYYIGQVRATGLW